MKKRFLIFIVYGLLLAALPENVYSQAPQSRSSSDMYLAIRRLNVLGSVLYVAAHPDDENTRLIAYLAKEKMYRTGYLSITRGDGGQNLIGDEQGIELGLIRTQELLAARRIDGGEQFFTRAFDFGYSKNPQETFTKWDKEKILSDVVWVIRKFQPDVVITRFPTTGEGGHGHHTASAILAEEAFTAAADPKRFPEQLKYVKPWQVKRLLWNTFRFGNTNTVSEDQFKFDVGGYNALLGKSYGEIAADSRSQHKSQGFGVAAGRGEALEYFTTLRGTAPVNDLMDGVDLSWKRVPGGDKISKMVDAIAGRFDLMHPEKSVTDLVELYKVIAALPDGYWKTQKLKETKELIMHCSGLWMDAFAAEPYAVQTDSVKINFSINNRLGVDAYVKNVSIDGFDTLLNKQLEKNTNLNFSKTLYVPAEKPVTQPYWLEHKMEEGYYNVINQELIGEPDVQPAYTARVETFIYGHVFVFEQPVKYRHTDPVKGELYQPLVVVPAFSVSSEKELFVLLKGQTGYRSLIFKANKNQGEFKIFDSGKNVINAGKFSRKGEIKFWQNAFAAAAAKRNGLSNHNRNEKLEFEYFYDTQGNFCKSQFKISYDHIPAIHYFKPAINKYVLLDLNTYNKNIGYITGAGDKVPEALEQMGYEVTLLTEKELSKNNLGRFDAIITGVRAYNTNEWMNNYYDKLMSYVQQGGNLIVQYNTSNFISSITSKIGPYDFTISRNRVTDETAKVHFLQPDHPVLNFPNKITEDDFSGWVQERSVYDAGTWDKNFTPVLSMNDAGEKPDEGSLIIANYGKGTFVYTGLVFFRQLPAGVPGAYRLLANMIALNKKKTF